MSSPGPRRVSDDAPDSRADELMQDPRLPDTADEPSEQRPDSAAIAKESAAIYPDSNEGTPTPEEIAVEAYRVIGLRDYGRFDMRMLGDEPQILDVNPNPELDPQSVVLAGAKVKGMTYGQMASRIVQLAAERMPS